MYWTKKRINFVVMVFIFTAFATLSIWFITKDPATSVFIKILAILGAALLAFYIIGLQFELSKNKTIEAEKTKMSAIIEEMEKTKARMSSAQSMAHVGNWELDVNSHIIWLSEESARMHGFPKKNSTYAPQSILDEYIFGEERHKLRVAYHNLLEGKGNYDIIYKVQHRDTGDVRFIHSIAELKCDQDGKPDKMIGVVQDITDSMLAEEKIKEKEELFRTIFEQSPVGICFGTATGQMVNVNPMLEKITGRTSEELLQLTWQDITHPDDIEKDMKLFQPFIHGENDGFQLIKRYLRPDGTSVWVNITVAPMRIENKPHITHLCIVEDVTQRLESEAELRERERRTQVLMSNLPGMAYRSNADKDFTMQFVSDGCYELTGYEPEQLVNSKDLTFNDLISPGYRNTLWKIWDITLANRSVFKEEYEIITASGETKWVFEQGRGIYDDEGNPVAIEGIIIDISKQKKREREILYLSYHDVLTGLYNRAYFEEAVMRLNRECRFPLSVIIGDINGTKFINDTLGHAEGDKAIVAIGSILKECIREGDILARTGGDEYAILLPDTGIEEASKLVKRIEKRCEAQNAVLNNELYHLGISLGYDTKFSADQSFSSVIKSAEDYMYRKKLVQNKGLHSAILASMKTSLFEKSHETEEHTQRITRLSKAIGKQMKLSDVQLNELELVSTLHDIGKIGISDVLLNKPSDLEEHEWVEMRKHPEIGFRIAMSTPELNHIAEYILSHHERWDGTGYPQGLKGEEIPLLSRIIAIVDAYDAMTEDRSYRKAMSVQGALDEIAANAGKQFDPELCSIFIRFIQDQMIDK